MVKATRNKTVKKPQTAKIKNVINSRRNQSAANCAVTETATTTKGTPLPNLNEFNGIRNCVVKIKRIKLNENSNASPKNLSILDVNKTRPSSALSCIESIFEPSRNSTMCIRPKQPIGTTACRVRICRLSAIPEERNLRTTACRVRICRLSVIPEEKKKLPAEPEKKKERFFHRDQPPPRTRSSVTRNVYEFLSESQIDDTNNNQNNDPAADIIKQMVQDGRACVMTRLKTGKSRMRPVARKKLRPVGKRKQCSLKMPLADEAEPPPLIEMPLSPIYNPEPDPESKTNSTDDDDSEPNEAPQIEVPVQVHVEPQIAQLRKTLPEGAYSPLARSLLLNQTKMQSPQPSMERRRELVTMARKFISTPLNRRATANTTANATAISPVINLSGNKQMVQSAVAVSPSGGSSPWRVPDEVSMPNTFVFGLNTSQLPSYSCDHIRKPHVYMPDERQPEAVTEPVVQPIPDGLEQYSNVDSMINDSNGENVPAQRSLRKPVTPLKPRLQENGEENDSMINDSNGENMSPPQRILEKPVTPMKSSDQENQNEENIVQLPNPRRTLQHRTPLKDINILEVVVLPPWKKNIEVPKTPTRDNASNHVRFDDSIFHHAKTIIRPQTPRAEQSSRSLFGFEEFLSDDERDVSNMCAQSQNVTLNERLHRLKGLRPTDKELPIISKTPLRYAYDDLTAHEPKQRNIKEMLCSTMIATPARQPSTGDESTGLFRDMDPEVTFDEKKPRRTYVRERPKRKRKQRVHVLFIESESSESEDNEQDSNGKSGESPKKALPVKRMRRDREHEEKLKQFITSFNKECEEVEKFPMMVE